MKKFFLLLCLTAGGGCSSQKKEQPYFLQIPRHILKEPTGLAFDGEGFYIADWLHAGLLYLTLQGHHVQIKPSIRALAVVAVGRGRLLIETTEGEFYFWKKAAAGDSGAWGAPARRAGTLGAPEARWAGGADPAAAGGGGTLGAGGADPALDSSGALSGPLALALERYPGEPFCWDGLYLWFAGGEKVYPAIFLDETQIAFLPGREQALGSHFAAQERRLSAACGWNRSVILSQYENNFSLTWDFLSEGTAKKTFWQKKNLKPQAVVFAGAGHPVVLAAQTDASGSFVLVEIGL